MLDDPLLVLETDPGTARGTLPDAFAALCSGTLRGFDGLAAHQRVPWLLFLAQTAAVALVRAGNVAAADDAASWRALGQAAFWRQALAALTPTCADSAWSVVVEDPAKPALLQPPVRAGFERYGVIGRTPDEIDLLVTAKAHDVKPARVGDAEPRHWLFALVSLQTHQGYSGRGNFGIARMNGGFASRPMVMLTPGRDWPTRFRRAVRAALAARAHALDEDTTYYRQDGLPLLWLEPWDKDEGLDLANLDPLFVEICRRVRLVRQPDGTLLALGRSSECARVAVSKDTKGNLGDPWTPIADRAALTVARAGFDYRLLFRLLATDDFAKPASLQALADDPEDLWLHAAVLVRGQGKTEGLHDRWERVPKDQGAWQRAGAIGKQMIEDAKAAKGALHLGILSFLQGGPGRADLRDSRDDSYLEQFERTVDGCFLRHLFARARAGRDAETEGVWKTDLVTAARRIFAAATAELRPPETRRERASAIAELRFGGALRKAALIEARTNPVIEDAA